MSLIGCGFLCRDKAVSRKPAGPCEFLSERKKMSLPGRENSYEEIPL